MFSRLLVSLALALSVLLSNKTTEAQTDLSALIPDTFQDQDISNYRIRYVSETGTDSERCLEGQLYPPSNAVSYCATIRFALLGTHEYKNSRNITNLIVLLMPGNYTYGNVSVRLTDFTNLVISKVPDLVGEVVLYCETDLEQGYNNLYITNSDFVALNELVFERCGPLSPGVGISNLRNLTISNCIARDNLHSGIVAHQTEDIAIYNCTFENNNSTAHYNITEHLNPGEIRFAGGLSISWQNFNTPSSAWVIDCTFSSNIASLSQLNSNDTRPSLYIQQGHGGAISTNFDNTTNHRLIIERTVFRGNRARFNGGGAFFSFYNKATGNEIVINGSIFEDNESRFGTGGAISISTFLKANGNQVSVSNTQFKNNNASVGGGGCSINIQDQLISSGTLNILNSAVFKNCTFVENSAPEGGSAVTVISNARVDQALDATKFIDCSFLRNKALEEGAVTSLRFPVEFNGRTIFKDNTGGGVAVLQSRMNVGGNIWFEGNTAEQGGALILRDQSVLHLLRHVNLTFIGNRATVRGGAIAVISPSVGLDTDIIRLFNTRCFIQYDVVNTNDATQPSMWNATFSFINNTAGSNGAAIHATDIDRCTYAPSLEEDDAQTISEKSLFALPGLFYFGGNRVLDNNTGRVNEYLASAPSKILISPQTVIGAPGEVVEFHVSAVDQSGNSRRAVWSLLDNSVTQDPTEGQDYFVLTPAGSTHRYTIHTTGTSGNVYENCTINQTLGQIKIDFNLVQIIAGDIASSNTSIINVSCCHPGYVFNEERSVCEYDRNNKVIIRGDMNHRYLYIEPEHYAEVRNGVIVSAVIPPTFQNCEMLGTLRGCLFKYDSPDEQCSKNRSGFLCGNCPEGQYLDLTLRNCRECDVKSTIIVIVVFVVLVSAAVLVLIFNIGVPNDLKGCFFFVQVVGFVYQSSNNWDFHLSRLFASFYMPICPLPVINAYVTASYGLVVSIVAMIIIIGYVICARFIKRLGHHSSLEGIWLLFIFVIKYGADTAFILLRCQRVTGEGVDEFVYFYDGTEKCFTFDDESRHLGFAIAAIFILILVIAAVIGILVVSYRRIKHTQAFTDILTNGIKVSCRWWSSFDLFRRLLFVLVEFLLNYIQPDYNQLAQFAVGLFIFFVFAYAQPYKERRANIIEALILLDLLALTSLFLNTADHSQNSVNGIAAILLLLPFIFACLYIIFQTISYVWKKWSPTSFIRFCKRLRDLIMNGKWIKQVKGGVKHSLDAALRAKDGSVVEEDPGITDFSSDYNELREELLDNAQS